VTELGVSAREYLDLKFAHLESGVARIENRLDGELRALQVRVDLIEKECDERRGRDKSTEAAVTNLKWGLGFVVTFVTGLVIKLVSGG